MLDIKLVREKTDIIIEALNKRGEDTNILGKLLEMEKERKAQLITVEELRQQRNKLSEEIGKLKKQGEDTTFMLDNAKKISDEIAGKEQHLRELEKRTIQELLLVPNIPHDSVPPGKDETENAEVRAHGEKPPFSFNPPRITGM
jgi:seryl-tRNA synthetase